MDYAFDLFVAMYVTYDPLDHIYSRRSSLHSYPISSKPSYVSGT